MLIKQYLCVIGCRGILSVLSVGDHSVIKKQKKTEDGNFSCKENYMEGDCLC